MKITHYGDVDRKRATEYPSVQRQLDMIWKALEELEAKPPPKPFSLDIKMMIQLLAAIKAKYPDPP